MFQLNRRDCLRTMGASLAGCSLSGWMPSLANALSDDRDRKRHCILLWMPGGPSQTDTFDMKPDHENGGEFKPISTNVTGIKISEHLPRLAEHADKMAIIRSLSTAEGDHDRGTYLMHTGQRPGGPIQYPTIGASLAKSLGDENADMPNFINILPFTAFGTSAYSPGFLGPRYAALEVGAQPNAEGQESSPFASLGVNDLHSAIQDAQQEARLRIWNQLQSNFMAEHNTRSTRAQDTVFERAVRMMNGPASTAFDLSQEPDSLRESYGSGRFGQACLMARRMIEHGVPFIEIALSGNDNGLVWDTHGDNFTGVRTLSAELDAGWAALMSDLDDRGLLESTTILWMGEFGRTPTINEGAGRDHFPNAWSCVLAGGGIAGGQTYGATSDDGQTVVDGMVNVGDLMATLCVALGVDPNEQNISELERPIRIAEGTPIKQVLS